MTLDELIEQLKAEVERIPSFKDQTVWNISIRPDSTVAISLDTAVVLIKIF